MSHTRFLIFTSLRLLVLWAGMGCVAVHADEYGDVSQMVRTGKLTEAMARADQFLASQPKDPQMRFIKGVIQRDTGKTAEAISTFTRLTEDYPELPEPYNNLAVLYASQSQFDKARAALEMAIRTNPSYATAHENLGDIYAKMASQAYNKALQLDNSNQAVPPKLALIREIFSTGGSKVQRPVPATPAVSSPAQVVAANTKPAVQASPNPVATVPSTPPPAKAAASTAPPATSVAAVAAPTTQAKAADDESVKAVEAAVGKWASAWSARNVKAYLAAYGKDFDPPGSMSRKAWEEERQLRIVSKSAISVKVENLNVTVNGNRAVAKFHQEYKAGGLAVSSRKTLEFAKAGDGWLILKETVGN
jgi:tetratricopeptide (TPR) repeat protein